MLKNIISTALGVLLSIMLIGAINSCREKEKTAPVESSSVVSSAAEVHDGGFD